MSQASVGASLTIDLSAIAANYRLLTGKLGMTDCAGVVKADAYGLGAEPVSLALYEAGCRTFFTAHLDEAIALRPVLAEDATLYVLHGVMPGAEAECLAHNITPVLNSPEQVTAWKSAAAARGEALPAILQLDTGMSRMGLSPEEAESVAQDLSGLNLQAVMSHLASADDPADPTNEMQRQNFEALRRLFPGAPASFANSSGIFLGADYHFDLARPGVALYGVNPTPGKPNPMHNVVSLSAKIVNIRQIEAGDGVGYGLTYRADGPRRIATIAIGYADGFLRSLSSRGAAYWNGQALPIAGRVSMDSVGIDISAVPAAELQVGSSLELLGPTQDLDQLARDAGTIGYEILTGLGSRFYRTYRTE